MFIQHIDENSHIQFLNAAHIVRIAVENTSETDPNGNAFDGWRLVAYMVNGPSIDLVPFTTDYVEVGAMQEKISGQLEFSADLCDAMMLDDTTPEETQAALKD